jgi:hypothetical protein
MIVAVWTSAAAAADEPPAWHVDVTPYVWAAGIYGDVGVGRQTAHMSASFVDILENSDSLIGLQGRVAVSRGPWGGFVDGTYIKLTEDAIGPARIDATARTALLEFGLTYRVLDTAVETGWTPGERAPGVAIDLYGGGRYTYLELDLDTQGQPSASRSVDWVDPMIGARAIWNVTNRFFVLAGGDIGGFGVGSDFAWSVLGLLGWRFQMFGLDSAVVGGYRALGEDYSTGSGPRRLQFDATLHGPLLGLNIRF